MERIYNKIDLAVEQLDAALSLFLSGSHVPALTLAGAAEEILGRALLHRGDETALARRWDFLTLADTIGGGRRRNPREFARHENSARNALKHMSDPTEKTVAFDPEDASLAMLVRACWNYDLLGSPPTPKMDEFRCWYDEHAVGH